MASPWPFAEVADCASSGTALGPGPARTGAPGGAVDVVVSDAAGGTAAPSVFVDVVVVVSDMGCWSVGWGCESAGAAVVGFASGVVTPTSPAAEVAGSATAVSAVVVPVTTGATAAVVVSAVVVPAVAAPVEGDRSGAGSWTVCWVVSGRGDVVVIVVDGAEIS